MLVRGSATALLVTVVAQTLTFGLQVLLARILGPVEFGLYSYAFAWFGVCLILAKLGMDAALIRLVAELVATGRASTLRGLIRFARGAGVTAAMVISLIAVLVVTGTSGTRVASLTGVILAGALLLPVAVYSELTAAALRGLRRVGVALAGDGILRPLVVAGALVTASLALPGNLSGWSALLFYVLGTLASLVMTGSVLSRSVPRASAASDSQVGARCLRLGLSLLLANASLAAMYAVDTLLLGVLTDTTTAGYYSVASRIAVFVLFVMNAAQTFAAPMLASAAAGGVRADVLGVVRTLNVMSIAAGVPIGLGLLIGAEPLLGVFGPDFREASGALRILAVSQMLNVLTGPTGLTLSMTGNERPLVVLLICGLALQIALNLVLIPPLGLAGAAMAALVAHMVWNIAGVVVVRVRLGIDITAANLLPAWRN